MVAGTEIGVDITDLQRNEKPTRDVLVTFTKENDREFVGFGSAKNDEFADCFLEADKLPLDKLKVQRFVRVRLCAACSQLTLLWAMSIVMLPAVALLRQQLHAVLGMRVLGVVS